MYAIDPVLLVEGSAVDISWCNSLLLETADATDTEATTCIHSMDANRHLPHVPTQTNGDTMLDSGAIKPLIFMGRLTAHQQSLITSSPFKRAKGVGAQPLPLIGEVTIPVSIPGSNKPPVNITHLVHNSIHAPPYLLGHSVLRKLGFVLDYDTGTARCGDATFIMPFPEEEEEESVSRAHTMQVLKEWNDPPLMRVSKDTQILPKHVAWIPCHFSIPEMRHGHRFGAVLWDRARSHASIPAKKVGAVVDLEKASVPYSVCHCTAVRTTDKQGSTKYRALTFLAVANPHDFPIVVSAHTAVGRMLSASHNLGDSAVRLVHLSDPCIKRLDVKRDIQYLETKLAQLTLIEELTSLPPPIINTLSYMTDAPASVKDAVREADIEFFFIHGLMETHAQEEQTEMLVHQLTHRNIETSPTPALDDAILRKLGVPIDELRTNAVTDVPEDHEFDWPHEDRKARLTAEDISPPTAEELSRTSLLAVIDASIKQAILDGLTPAQTDLLRDVLHEEILPMAYDPRSKGVPGAKVDPVKYHLRPDAKPKYVPVRNYSPAGRAFKKAMELELLQMKVIEHAKSPCPWASAVHLARKKNGEFRFTVDLKHVNAQVIGDQYPIPKISTLIDTLSGAKWFSTIDCVSGFWNFPLHPMSRPLTAFHGEDGKMYQFTRLVQGMKPSSAEFQRRMDVLFSGLSWNICLCYIDDIIVYTQTYEEHIAALRQVLGVLRKANIIPNLAKSRFCCRSVAYMGFRISDEGISTDEALIEKIKSFGDNLRKPEAESFLGLTVHFRRFIHRYAEICRPIREAINESNRTKAPFKFDANCVAAVQHLKQVLVSKPIFRLPDPSRPYRLYTDASNYAIGCVLTQVDDNGEEYVVLYDSITLHKEQRGWGITDREAYAVVHYVHKLAHYLDNNQPFLVFTDHGALTTVLKNPKDNGKLLRWALSLTPYVNKMLVQHWPGKSHIADFFSRHPDFRDAAQLQINPQRLVFAPLTEDEKDSLPAGLINSINHFWIDDKQFESDMDINSENLKKLQREDDLLSAIIKAIESCATNEAPRCTDQSIPASIRETANKLLTKHSFFIAPNGVLKRVNPNTAIRHTDEIVLPEGMHLFVLSTVHDTPTAGHLGVDKMLSKLEGRFFWHKMKKSVRDWYQACHLCQMTKAPRRPTRGELKSFTAYQPFTFTSLDLIGPLPETDNGNKYLLVFTDYHTRWVEAVALPNKKAVTVARAFHDLIGTRYGSPLVVMSDRGKEFLNNVFNQYCALNGTAHWTTSPYHPETNRLVERFNSTLIAMIAPFVCYSQRDWDSYISSACWAYRSARHATTKFSPFELMHGWLPRQPLDAAYADEVQTLPIQKWREDLEMMRAMAARNTDLSHDRTKERVNKKRIANTFKVGDLVRVHVLAGLLKDPAGTKEFEKNRVIKLAWKYRGPFKIEALHGHQAKLAYVVNSKVKRTANIDDLEFYYTNLRLENALRRRADDALPDEILEEEFIVEAIKSHDDIEENGETKRYYTVTWEGYDDKKFDTRETIESFNDYEHILEYERALLRSAKKHNTSLYDKVVAYIQQQNVSKVTDLRGNLPFANDQTLLPGESAVYESSKKKQKTSSAQDKEEPKSRLSGQQPQNSRVALRDSELPNPTKLLAEVPSSDVELVSRHPIQDEPMSLSEDVLGDREPPNVGVRSGRPLLGPRNKIEDSPAIPKPTHKRRKLRNEHWKDVVGSRKSGRTSSKRVTFN